MNLMTGYLVPLAQSLAVELVYSKIRAVKAIQVIYARLDISLRLSSTDEKFPRLPRDNLGSERGGAGGAGCAIASQRTYHQGGRDMHTDLLILSAQSPALICVNIERHRRMYAQRAANATEMRIDNIVYENR